MRAELEEFIELSKTVTQGRWGSTTTSKRTFIWRSRDELFTTDGEFTTVKECSIYKCKGTPNDAAFIARSRNISPTMAECLLVTVKGLEHALLNAQAGWTDFARFNRGSPDYDETYQPVYGQDVKSIETALQQTLATWEAAL